MALIVIAPPASEPVTLNELKLHLRYDGGTFADNLDSTQSIPPGSHAIANNFTTHVGAAVEVLGYSAVVLLEAGTNGATGTVDVKIQESDDNSAWTDWTGGAFTQVTTANDNATFERAYTGTKRYVRTVAKVLLVACEFGTSIVRNAATSVEDDLLNAIIVTAREQAEGATRRALITQTLELVRDAFPTGGIELYCSPIQSVTSIKYIDTAGAEQTLSSSLYDLDNDTEPGMVAPAYNESWPATRDQINAVRVRYVAGWTSAIFVPSKIKSAIKLLCADLYKMRGEPVIGQTVVENKTADRLLASARVWGSFA